MACAPLPRHKAPKGPNVAYEECKHGMLICAYCNERFRKQLEQLMLTADSQEE